MSSLVRRLVLTFAMVSLLACARSAHADTYQMTFSGAGITGLAFLTATPDGPGTFLVTAITGSVNGEAITGLIAPTTSTGFSEFKLSGIQVWAYDDLIMPGTNPGIDTFGLLFTVQGTTQPVNLFDNPPVTYGVFNGFTGPPGTTDRSYTLTPVTLSLIATPEPPALLLLASGLALLVGLMSRK